MNNTRTEDKPSTCNQFRKAQSETDCASDNYKLCVVCTRVSLHVGYDIFPRKSVKASSGSVVIK
jgi:hypothetical protein